MVHDPITGKGTFDKTRTSSVVQLTPELLDWFSLQIDLQLQGLSKVSRIQGEPLNLLQYTEGQEYKPHYDAIVGGGAVYEAMLADGGQRIKTALCYLSDDYSGGETIFPKLKLKLKGGKGDVIFFNNLTEDGNVQRLSYHASSPIIFGQKWILNKWMRGAPTSYGNHVYTNVIRGGK
jgi:prolyl 4-hydroxylase